MTRYAKRKDANHNEIRDHFIRLLGANNVLDCFRFGDGFPDLVVQYSGLTMLVEIKTATGKLTKAQKKCPLMMRVVRNRRGVEETVMVLQTWADVLRQNMVMHKTREEADEATDKSGGGRERMGAIVGRET